jgi:hypothetical protein
MTDISTHEQESKRLCYLVGIVCTQFSTLEYFLGNLCSKLMGPDGNIGAMVAAECSFARLVALAKSLVYHKSTDAEVCKAFDALATMLATAETHWNTVLHSTWAVSIGGDTEFARSKTTSKLKKGLYRELERVSAADLQSKGEFIARTFNALMDFDQRMMKLGLAESSKVPFRVHRQYRGPTWRCLRIVRVTLGRITPFQVVATATSDCSKRRT